MGIPWIPLSTGPRLARVKVPDTCDTLPFVGQRLLSDFVPPITRQTRSSPAVTESTSKHSIQSSRVISSSSNSLVCLFNSADASTVSLRIPASGSLHRWPTNIGSFPTDQPLLHLYSIVSSSVKGEKGWNCPFILSWCQWRVWASFQSIFEADSFLWLCSGSIPVPHTLKTKPLPTHTFITLMWLSLFLWTLISSRLVVIILCSLYLTSIVVRTRNFFRYIGVSTAHWDLRKSQKNSNLFSHLPKVTNRFGQRIAKPLI